MRSWSRAGEGSLGRGRQSVAHGVVAAVTDVRAVDGGEVTVGLGRRQQAAGAAVPALSRERVEEGTGEMLFTLSYAVGVPCGRRRSGVLITVRCAHPIRPISYRGYTSAACTRISSHDPPGDWVTTAGF